MADNPMSGANSSSEVKQLEKRINAIKAAQAPKPRQDEHYSQAQLAWRMVIELVAGLGIGTGIGYGLDYFFGTSPWLMILFLFFGFAAGIQTMMRSAKEVEMKQDLSTQEAEKDKRS
ncbi:MAG: AtpZ/AtpI family protein [Aestuariivita sp.]|nr:AtpZ/AtpI family protein [Aestuariivita sp.]MCY4202138.1 AtpZ/AtpI family protein [Aestuariivita sp.]